MPIYSAATADLRLDDPASAGNQNNVKLTALAGGGFVASWSTAFVEGGQNSATHCQVYDATGAEIGAETIFAGGQFSTQPSITTLAGGGYVMAWRGDGAAVNEYSVQAFTAGGAPVGPLNTGAMSGDSFAPGPQVIALPNGGYMVGFEDANFAISVQAYSAAGVASPPEAVAPSFGGGFDVALLGGGFVITFNEFNFDTGRNDVKAQLVAFDGTPGPIITVDADAARSAFSSQVTAIAGGGFAVSWATQSNTVSSVRVALFDAAGLPVGPALDLGGGSQLLSGSSITTLANGDLAVSYGDQTGALFVQLLSPEGAKLALPFMADNNQAGAQFDGDIVALAGGGFAVAWDKNNNEIGARIFSPDWVIQTRGTAAGETLTAAAGQSTRLDGLGGNDILVGSSEADVLLGGLGNDRYHVHNATDQVIELAGQGVDEIYAHVSMTLGDQVENMVLQGSAAINATGNSLNNNLTGNSGANILDGRFGRDTMAGGGGNDIYVVNDPADVVTEAKASGADTVQSSISYTLGLYMEDLKLTGTGATSGTGNAGNNALSGNTGANVLKGEAGHDRINGGAGNDTIYGGAGNDTLFGALGIDGFRFDTALNAATNVDKIADFKAVDDTIFLDRSIFSGIAADGTLSSDAFRAGTAALDADDRIIYDQSTGKIFYDADGSGGIAAVLFAQVNANTALTNADFSGYP